MLAPVNQNQQLSASCNSTTQTKEQAQKMITDLWGAMMALFGDKWTRSYGEQVDKTGQWLLTLNGVSRQQIAAALNEIRSSGRTWPPVAPEFRAMCLAVGKEKLPPMEACFAELTKFITDNRKDKHNLSRILYHTITRNMDFYTYKKIEKDWERVKSFEIAYKATLFQLECGEELMEIPKPETLIEQNLTPVKNDTPQAVKAANETLSNLMSMFDEE